MGPRGLGWPYHCACDAETEITISIERQFGVQGAGLIYVNPLLNKPAAQKSMQVAIDFAITQGGTGVIDVLLSWNTFFTKYAVPAEVVCILIRFYATCLLTRLSPLVQRIC